MAATTKMFQWSFQNTHNFIDPTLKCVFHMKQYNLSGHFHVVCMPRKKIGKYVIYRVIPASPEGNVLKNAHSSSGTGSCSILAGKNWP